MAKKKIRSYKRVQSTAVTKDLSAWNFIMFLTIALILLVLVVSRMQSVAVDLRARAGLSCPDPLTAFGGKIPNTKDCSGEWKLSEDAKGCQVFLCQAK